jgi:hypothetical protein
VPPAPWRHAAGRGGSTLLEFEVALVVFGVALTGVLPLVVMHSRVVRGLERQHSAVGQWYLSPAPDPWARKLGACATLVAQDPGPVPKPAALVVDDSDPGYVETGAGWSTVAVAQALEGELCECLPLPPRTPPASAATAAWTFAGVVPGWYHVEATWLPARHQTAAAAYAFFDAGVPRGQATVNQTAAPAGTAYQGSQWQILGKAYFGSGAARVQVTAQPDGYLVTDGMMLAPVENNVQILSLQRSFNSDSATVNVSVTVAP